MYELMLESMPPFRDAIRLEHPCWVWVAYQTPQSRVTPIIEYELKQGQRRVTGRPGAGNQAWLANGEWEVIVGTESQLITTLPTIAVWASTHAPSQPFLAFEGFTRIPGECMWYSMPAMPAPGAFSADIRFFGAGSVPLSRDDYGDGAPVASLRSRIPAGAVEMSNDQVSVMGNITYPVRLY